MDFIPQTLKRISYCACAALLAGALFSCSRQKDVIIAPVEIILVQLALSDSLEPALGVEIHWDVEPSDSARLSYFDIYYKPNESAAQEVLIKEVSPKRRSLILNFPLLDSNASQIYFGVEAVYEEFTGQLWRSRDMVFEKLGLLPKINMLLPPEGSYQENLQSVFQVQSTHDRGVHYDFYAFLDVKGNREFLQRKNFPFESSDASTFYRTDETKDSLQFPFPEDTSLVKWCVRSTELPANNPLNLNQTLSCSYFYRIKPQ